MPGGSGVFIFRSDYKSINRIRKDQNLKHIFSRQSYVKRYELSSLSYMYVHI